MKQLEAKMDKYLSKEAPLQIPENGKKWIVKWLPIISLIFGALSLIAALGLWREAHRAQDLVDSVNELARYYGVDTAGYNPVDYGVLFYVAMSALVVQGVLMLYAYPGLKERSKSRGWNILLFSTLVSFAYGLFYAFTDTGSFFNLITSLIGVLIGLYILAQIRSFYNGTKKSAKR